MSAFCSVLFTGMTFAATPWWEQPTICKSNPTNCYASMGAGFDTGMWDAVSNCWGLKFVCPDALSAATSQSVLMGKSEIMAGTGIKNDFDIDILNTDCFGVRKTIANGSMASVNGSYVNVWCSGILSNPDETLPSGEITLGAQPTCKDLAPDGWIAVLNQKCYGKYLEPNDYYIECEGNNVLPSRIIVLNGSEKIVGVGSLPNHPIDTSTAKALFDTMQTVSASQKSKYF